MTNFIFRNRKYIIIVSILLSLAGAILIPAARTDPDIRNYIPATMQSRVNTDLIEEYFGVQDIVMVIFTDSNIVSAANLERITGITDALAGATGVKDVMSISNAMSIRGEEGYMLVEPALSSIPGNSDEEQALKEDLKGNPLVMGMVMSKDFTASSVVVYLDRNTPENKTIAAIDSILAAYPGKARVLSGGLPYIRESILKDVRSDVLWLVPTALIIMLSILWFSFRAIRGIVLPFSVVVLSLALAMGLYPLFGWQLSILSLLVPVMLIAVANNYGIHLVARYQEYNHRDPSLTVEQIIEKVLGSLRKPVLFTGLTTIAGILGLLTHSVIPARQVGVLTAIGVAYALTLSLFFIPSWMSFLRKPERRNINGNTAAPDGSSGYLASLGRAVSRNPVTVMIVSIIMTLALGSGVMFLKVDSNQENFFPPGHPVKKASEAINANFGGSQTISVMVEADILDPVNMHAIDRWSDEIEKEAGVGNVMSIAAVVKEMSKALFEPDDELYNSIPDTREALAQMVEIYNMSGDPEDFEQLVDLNYTRAHIMVRFSDPSATNIGNIVRKTDDLRAAIDGNVVTGGYAYIMEEFSHKIVMGQINSIISTVIVVFILLIIIFRSLQGGVIAIVPMIASIAIMMGIMGWTGIALDPATALLSSVIIGIGIDYTIHYMWRHISEMEQGLDHREAAARTIATTGRGIIFNAVSVMSGFLVLIFSNFTSIRYFGYLVIVSIAACLLAAMFTVPSIFILIKPGFVKNGTARKKNNNHT